MLRRLCQLISLACFLILLWYAAFPLVLPVPPDLFLNMDPLVFFTTLIAVRGLVPPLLLAAVILGFTVIFGRFFCSMVCPLGTTIDITDRMVRPAPFSRRVRSKSWKIVKYLVLSFVVCAALLKVSFAFLVAPIPLVTRLYGLVLYPVISLAADAGLNLIRPFAERIGAERIAYAEFLHQGFALRWLMAVLAGSIIACGILAPRFWCRYLCPAGAIFAIASRRPRWRRRVSPDCTSCGACRKKCPMDAIADDPRVTEHSECILCRTCAGVCPAGAVSFSFSGHENPRKTGLFSAHRRAFIFSGLSGAAAAFFTLSGMKGLSRDRENKTSLLRPPGAVPEDGFLARCVGCGGCMKTCPTNVLQPAGLSAGVAGILSPVMVPRIGPCEPSCNACGQVCPTWAIRPLPLDEKRYAKVGTASIDRQRCIAWKDGKACLVCDEVCPYGAVDLQRVKGISVAVPFVGEGRCNGCGFCENYCPVPGKAAIVVGSSGALRLEEGSYREKSRAIGLSIEPRKEQAPGPEQPDGKKAGQLPPGFTE
jgi:MauM/NapG family ferredoxin protein